MIVYFFPWNVNAALCSKEPQRHLAAVVMKWATVWSLRVSLFAAEAASFPGRSSAAAAINIRLEPDSNMGEITKPRRIFLWCMAAIYLAAFVSVYLQIPGELHTAARADSIVSLLAGNLEHRDFLCCWNSLEVCANFTSRVKRHIPTRSIL